MTLLILLFPRAADAADPATNTSGSPPPPSAEPVRKEIDDLRREVETLRSELLALKALITANSVVPSKTLSDAALADSTSTESGRKDAQSVEVASIAPPPVVLDEPSQEVTASPLAGETPNAVGFPQLFDGRVTLGGYGSMRFEANNVSPGNLVPGGSANGFTFRRFVLTTEAKVAPRLRIHSEIEFERLLEIELEKRATREAGGVKFVNELEGNAGGEIAIEQMWGQYDFAENHGFRAGIILPPLGRFNLLHDDDYWDLPRRTLTDRDAPVTPVPAAWRELGAGMVGRFNLPRSARLEYQFYVFNGTTLGFNLESVVQTRTPRRNKLELESEIKLASGAVDGSQGARAIGWRAAFSPTLAGEVALSGYHGRYTPSYLSVHEPINSLGLDWKWRKRGFETEGEFIYTSLGRVNRVLDDLAAKLWTSASETSSAEAAELESEIEIGVNNLARTRYGFWWDFKYHWQPEFLRKGFLAKPFDDPQIIPIARYERVWLNRQVEEVAFSNGVITDLTRQDLSQDRISLGLNYRPARQFGFQLAWEHNRRVKGSRLIFPAVPDRSTDGILAGMSFAF